MPGQAAVSWEDGVVVAFIILIVILISNLSQKSARKIKSKMKIKNLKMPPRQKIARAAGCAGRTLNLELCPMNPSLDG